MKITMSTAQALVNLINQLQSKTISVKTAYKFIKLSESFNNDLIFYKQKMNEIVYKFCKLDENGQPIEDNGMFKIKPECQEECERQIIELQGIEITIEPIKFTLEELEGLELSFNELVLLKDFIEE